MNVGHLKKRHVIVYIEPLQLNIFHVVLNKTINVSYVSTLVSLKAISHGTYQLTCRPKVTA